VRIKLAKKPDENTAHKKPSKACMKKRKALVASGKVAAHESYKQSQLLVFSGQLLSHLHLKSIQQKEELSLSPKEITNLTPRVVNR